MITDKSRYGHDAVLDLDCGDSVQVLRTEPMTLTEQEQKIVQKYLGIALLEKSYIDANGHLMVVLSDGRTLDVGSARGLPGATPYIGANGNWFVEGVDTLQSARGLPGFTPYIGENEHWWIDKTDTGIPARGIPLIEKADNTRFLRNDGTWQKVTPENIGAAQAGVVADHESRIEALEQRTVTAPYYTDDSVAYIKEVPENALPFASVDMIGGMTRKCTNLAQSTADIMSYGCSVSIAKDGKVSLTTTEAHPSQFAKVARIALKAGVSYTISFHSPTSIQYGFLWYANTTESPFNVIYTELAVTPTADGLYELGVYLPDSSPVGTVGSLYVMINEGSTALPYEPYFDGLRSAPVTEVESVGVNLCDPSRIPDTLNGLTFTKNTDGTVTINGTANAYTTVYFDKFNLKTGEKFYCLGGSNGTTFTFNGHMGDTFIKNIGMADNTVVRTIECDGTYDSFYPIILIQAGQSFSNVTCRFIVSKTSFDSFLPYRRNTLPVPAEVQALDGYGWGINDKVYNYVDWENKQFVKRVGCVDMGTLNWTFNGVDIFYAGISDKSKGVSNFLSGKYPKANVEFGVMDDGTITGNASLGDIIYVKDSAYTDAATFKAAMSGVMLYYELAEPVITDLSDLLHEDNLIGVEGGGTVTMVNEYGYDVPSEITYARLTWQ